MKHAVTFEKYESMVHQLLREGSGIESAITLLDDEFDVIDTGF